MDIGFQFVSYEGDEWFEKRVTVAGHVILIQLRPEAEAFRASLPYAEAILDNIEHVISSLHDFVSNEMEKFPEYQEDFHQFIASTIAFVSSIEPDIAEITFNETPTGRIWGCAYKNGLFFNFGYDD